MTRTLYRVVAIAVIAMLGVAARAGTVKVGLSLPLTGVQSGVGKEVEAVWRAFAKQIQETRDTKGHKLEIVVADDAFDAARSKANAERFAQQGIAVVASTPGIPTVLSMAPVLEARRIPLLGPGSGSLELHEGVPAVFHVKASFGTEVDRMAALIGSMALKRVAVVTDDIPSRAALIERFDAALKRSSNNGAQLVSVVRVSQQGGDPKSAVAKTLSAQPDAVYVMTIPGIAGGVLKSLRAGSYKGFISAWSVTAIGSVLSGLGPDGKGIIFGSVVPSPTSPMPGLRADFHKFAKAHGITPSYRAMEVYLTGRVLVEALARTSAPQPKGSDIWSALESFQDADIGGWKISYTSTRREGSHFVDAVMLDEKGKFR